MKGIKGFQKGHKDLRRPESILAGIKRIKSLKKTPEWKKKIGDAHRGRKYPERMGENNPSWKGGVTSEQMKARKSLEYIIWRNEVYKKDFWTCRICKIKCRKGQIIAHHLKLFSDFPELRFSIDNGVTLCRKCHVLLHKGMKQIPEYDY